MANYIIIGGDGKEYGPVSEADVRQWIAEGRLSAESRAKAESDAEFRMLGQFPEFAGALRPQATPATISPIPAAAEFSERDYELDIAGCFSRGWDLVKGNMGLLFVSPLIYLLIQFVAGLLGSIPFIGPLFSLANFLCSGPLLGGIFYLFILVNRNEPAGLGDMFMGFRRGFVQLFLAVLVMGLAMGACMLPFIIVLIIKLIPLAGQLQQLQHLQPGAPPDLEALRPLVSAMLVSAPVALICAIPATYLAVCWKFTLPLIVDKQMDFGAAMKASWKMVNQHWWLVFGLIILIGLLNVVGMCFCCVGLLFSIPIGYAALIIAYETIFGAEKV